MMERRKTPLEQIESQKLAVLAGERGDPQDHALRRRQLAEVQALIAAVTKQAQVLTAALTTIREDLDAVQGDVTGLESQVATISAELAAAQDDLATLLTSVAGLAAAIADVPSHTAALEELGGVAVPSLTALDAAGAAPTDAEFNAVVADLAALRAAIADIVGAGL